MSDVFGAGAAAMAAAQVTVAIINTTAAIAISALQYKIAKGYLDLAKDMRDYWNGTFKPCEIKMVTEACSAPEYTPQYKTTAGRYVASVRQQFKNAIDDAARSTSRYCTGLTSMMVRDLAVAEAVAVGSAANFGFRYEEARKEILDQVRWDRRHQALSLGRDLIYQSANYAQMANGILSGLGDQAGRAAAGAMRALGYGEVRNDLGGGQSAGGGARTDMSGWGSNTNFSLSNPGSIHSGQQRGPQTFSSTSTMGQRGTYGGSATTIDPYRFTRSTGIGTGPGTGFGVGQDSGGGTSSDAGGSGLGASFYIE